MADTEQPYWEGPLFKKDQSFWDWLFRSHDLKQRQEPRSTYAGMFEPSSGTSLPERMKDMPESRNVETAPFYAERRYLPNTDVWITDASLLPDRLVKDADPEWSKRALEFFKQGRLTWDRQQNVDAPEGWDVQYRVADPMDREVVDHLRAGYRAYEPMREETERLRDTLRRARE